jgi:hypothetical protein
VFRWNTSEKSGLGNRAIEWWPIPATQTGPTACSIEFGIWSFGKLKAPGLSRGSFEFGQSAIRDLPSVAEPMEGRQ